MDDYTCPKVQNMISKLKKNLIGGVATTHFVMQIVFNVQKEKLLHTENGLNVFFLQIVNNLNNFVLSCF